MRRMKRLVLALLATSLLGACVHAPERNPLAEWVPSPNHDPRDPIIIVLHATEQQSAAESLVTLSTANAGGPVSLHSLVGGDGRIYQLVDEARAAWHAARGRCAPMTDLNPA